MANRDEAVSNAIRFLYLRDKGQENIIERSLKAGDRLGDVTETEASHLSNMDQDVGTGDTPSWANQGVILQFGGDATQTATEEFLAINGNPAVSTGVTTAIAASNNFIAPYDMTITGYAIQHDGDLSSNNGTFDVYLNGSSESVSVSLTGGANTTYNNNNLSISVSAGAKVAVSIVGTGTAPGNVSVALFATT